MNGVESAESSLSAKIHRRLSGFSLARQWRLTRKELAETLRDRRTIVTLVLMPILVYPLLSIIFRQFLTTSLGKPGNSIAIICVDTDEQRERLEDLITRGERLLELQARTPEHAPTHIEPALVDEPAYNNVRTDVGDAERKLREGRVDLVVRELTGEPQRVEWQILYAARSPGSTPVRSFVERRLRAVNDAIHAATHPNEQTPSLVLQHEAVAVDTPSRSLLPAVVPLVLLMMTITGAVYPAIDLTAGERERGTLEALVAAPVSRTGVLMAKYVAVLTVALLTGSVNLLAMSITLYSAGLASLLVGPEQSVGLLAVEVFGLLLLFASFFSAVLLAVTSLARSFKEAQAYLIPLMLVTLGPGLLSLSPALELSGPMAFVPLVNVVLLARDVFSGTAEPLASLIVVVSTGLYAVISISIAARIFGSDAILYGSGGSWSELFRRPTEAKSSPGFTAASLCVAVVFAGMINLGGSASLLAASLGNAGQLLVSAVMTVFVFAAIPLAAAIVEKVRLRDAFRIITPSILSGIGAVLLGASLGILVIELTAVLQQGGFITINPALEEAVKQKAAELNRLPLGLVLVTLAIVPAIAEELFFRGYLFQALQSRFSPPAAILVSSIVFALFHTFGLSGLTLERLLPSLLLGIALGTVAWKSGSVWSGMVLHALNNAILLTIARYRDDLVGQGVLVAGSEHLPTAWLAAAGVAAMIGFAIVVWSRPLNSPASKILHEPA
jgi:ABC-2 type transport system permease protein/sodium transport system permease protein